MESLYDRAREVYSLPVLDDIRESYEFDVTCGGTMPVALSAFFESTDFEDAIRNAVSVGGDSDTIAAVTGALAEAYYGVPDDLWRSVPGCCRRIFSGSSTNSTVVSASKQRRGRRFTAACLFFISAAPCPAAHPVLMLLRGLPRKLGSPGSGDVLLFPAGELPRLRGKFRGLTAAAGFPAGHPVPLTCRAAARGR